MRVKKLDQLLRKCAKALRETPSMRDIHDRNAFALGYIGAAASDEARKELQDALYRRNCRVEDCDREPDSTGLCEAHRKEAP